MHVLIPLGSSVLKTQMSGADFSVPSNGNDELIP